jgi:predicted Zn-dependent protease
MREVAAEVRGLDEDADWRRLPAWRKDREIFQVANRALAAGRETTAVGLVAKGCQLYGYPFCCNAFSEILMQAARFGEARTVLEKLIAKEADDGKTNYLLARLEVQEGEFDAARKHLALASRMGLPGTYRQGVKDLQRRLQVARDTVPGPR